MLRRLAKMLTGRTYVGTDSLGNQYFQRPHPKYEGRVLRELVPPSGQDPSDYDPDQVSGEWTHWLQGGGENGQPLDPVVIQDAEDDGPSGPLSRSGTGLFEPPKSSGDAYTPQGWAPSSRPANPVPTQHAEESSSSPLSRPGTGVFEEPAPSGDAFKPKGWRPG